MLLLLGIVLLLLLVERPRINDDDGRVFPCCCCCGTAGFVPLVAVGVLAVPLFVVVDDDIGSITNGNGSDADSECIGI